MPVLGRGRRTDVEEVFETLFRREFASLVRALTLVAGDAEAAADAVQDAFVQAHRHRERVLAMENPRAWLRHVALNRIRNQHRGHEREANALPGLVSVTPQTAPAPEVADDVATSALLSTLSPQQRSAAAMYYLLDQSTAAIAEHLGITDATVRSHLRTARQRLHEHLEQEGA